MVALLRLSWLSAGLVVAFGQGIPKTPSVSLLLAAKGQDEMAYAQRNQGKQGGKRREFPAPKSAWEFASVVLGCPTKTEITMVIHPNKAVEMVIDYGITGQVARQSTPNQSLKAGSVLMFNLRGLKPDTAYTYRLRCRLQGDKEYQASPEYGFHTQRPVGSPFSFYVQGDSHPERNPKMCDPALYERTLLTAAQTKPDFYICLGDDFSVDTLNEFTQPNVEAAYLKQIPYLGLVGHSAPVFLVNGNHEQAAKVNLDGTAKSLGVWAQNARNEHFAQPAPNDFYSGDTENVPNIGLLRDYYAWTWGDALFVVIDPYWHSDVAVDNRADGGPKQRDLWKVTLGDKQYQWLKKTLGESKAKFKFVFSHHVTGTGRGGVECAPYYEWGGKDRNGQDIFASKRPGWAMPIHQLFVKTGVTIFFQGHDHIFAKQVLDGVIYQTAPCPGDSTYTLMNDDAYLSGDKFPGSGVIRVTVDGGKARVDYVRSYLPADETGGKKNGEVAFSYSVSPRAMQK